MTGPNQSIMACLTVTGHALPVTEIIRSDDTSTSRRRCFGQPQQPDEVGRDHDRGGDAVIGDGVEDQVGVEPTRHHHRASGQEKADCTVRSSVVQRPDDEVRAQPRHVVARHRLQPIVDRRRDQVGELDCLGLAGRPRGVDQIRRGGQFATRTTCSTPLPRVTANARRSARRPTRGCRGCPLPRSPAGGTRGRTRSPVPRRPRGGTALHPSSGGS